MKANGQSYTITLVIGMNKNFSCGKRIRELRTERGLSQEKLALNAGITPAYLGLVEREKRNATVVIIERICAAMNISLAEFFSETENSKDRFDSIDIQIMCEICELEYEEKKMVLTVVREMLAMYQKGQHRSEKKDNSSVAV